jgi:HSP20 family molecular chaperone IbpA
MANFFEKLKKGMGIEIPVEEEKPKEEKEEKPKEEKKEKPKEEKKIKKTKIELKVKEVEKPKEKEEKPKEEWLENEGELAVDVYQTETELIIQSAIAGVKPEQLNVSLEGDMITIEGERQKPSEGGDYFIQECYWGKFSRKIILPVEINPDGIEATFKDGILTIKLQKISKEKKRKILIKS